MKTYLDILKYTLENGKRQENRTGIDTFAVPNMHFSHNMSDGFPLLTTKRIAWKTMSIELEGFIQGITNKKWFEERNCKIWSDWANTETMSSNLSREEKIKWQREHPDLGPLGYSHGWRNFGGDYPSDIKNGYDQFDYVIRTLKSNPNDRRMVVSAWNPQDLKRVALPSCHFAWVVTHIEGELHLHWTQRSCDLFLGVPFNIASYALLLCLLCKESNMKPGNLSGMLCNCHIYENHIDQVKEQLSRQPTQLPELKINNWNNIYTWTHKDIEFINYKPQSKIVAPVAV